MTVASLGRVWLLSSLLSLLLKYQGMVRAEMVEALSPLAAESQRRISEKDEDLGIEYQPGRGGETAAASKLFPGRKNE